MIKDQIADLIKQAEQMQEKMKKIQEELIQTVVKGESGAGLVIVELSCKYEVRRVWIAPSLMTEEKEMIEDLVAAAINDATKKIEAIVQQKVGSITNGQDMGMGGMGAPGGFKLPL